MRGVLVLTIVGFLSASLLVLVHNYTKKPIEAAKEKEKAKALQEIFPFEFDLRDVKQIKEKDFTFYEITTNGKLKALAIETFTDEGYGGRINVLMSITPDCKFISYKVLSHAETPGLGDKITTQDFKKQFKDKGLTDDWRVTSDGGFVDAITAATISSRAITDALKKGLDEISEKYGCEK